ncbi:acetamidase/formamidase family protein [Variovorax guangxiensis]|uniref:acetamidase/formamidase family protein n=1 Tax=Variovorax guangxiensis TaxID=1775474 RepID=UPI00286594DE|nr:acetamidase/formamidase family protein [Variovorax guangxiensis]MDR6860993.1 acetamidase/formamidase [Variovorax guangxiensis]
MSYRAHACGAAAAAATLLIAGGSVPPTAHAHGPDSIIHQKTSSADGEAGKRSTVRLEGNPQTTQFGWFDNSQAPVLRIRSGDTIVMETLIHGDKQIVMNEMTIERMTLRAKQEQAESPGRGPHSITGPVYVEGAQPGDVLKIEIGKIVPSAYALNFSYPGFAGAFPKLFPQGQLKYFLLDHDKQRVEFAPGIHIPLRPFPGLIAVARAEPGPYSTVPPGRFGGNLDINEMVSGTTVYLPVFVEGGLLWSGDSHAAQGNGEINLTALETSFKELPLTVTVLKGKKLEWPRVETPTHWLSVGYDKDLNQAFHMLQEQTSMLIAEQSGLSPTDARSAMLSQWDCRISEIVNVLKGTYCMVPKAQSASGVALPTQDIPDAMVSYARNVDLNKAMDEAALSMIDRLAGERGLTRLEAYSLASMAMDCRLGRPAGAEREVHCLMKKNLWTASR